MKTKKLLTRLFVILFVFSFVSCKDNKDEIKEIAPETAKVELRNATQGINLEMNKVMGTPSMQTMSYLSVLMDAEWGKNMQKTLFQSGKLHLAKIKDNFRLDASGNRNATEVGDYGIYTYNFDLDDFELTSTSTNQLQVNFPAGEQAHALQQNNAVFTLGNLEYTSITYTETWWDEWEEEWVTETYQEEVPTNADLSLKVDGISIMSGSYHSELSSDGTPTLVNANVTSAPYQFQMSLNGSGTNYSTSLSFKEGSTELMGYNLDIVYSSNLEDVEKLSGNYTVNPLKAQGTMNMAKIEARMELIGDEATNGDIDYLNTQLAVELHHTALNSKLGDIMFKLYVDEDYDEAYPELAIVYSDGSFDWLYEIMGENGSYKRVKPRR
jgi:hypothetical protein